MVDFERSIKEGSSDNRIIFIVGSCCWWRRSLLCLILLTIFTLLAVVGESFAAIIPYRRHRRTLWPSAFSSSSSSFSSDSNRLVMKMTKTSLEDTEDFLQYAAAAVDLSSVHYIPEADAISVVRSVRDLDKEGRQKYLYHIPINRSGSNGSFKLPPTLMESTIQIRIPSPSGSKLMIVKQQPDGGDSSSKQKKCIIEIWQGDALTRRIAIENNKQHGPIINDPTGFGIPTWSPDESCILYVAERKPIATKPFWEEKEEGNDEINTTVNPTTAEKDDDVDNNKTPTTTIYGGQNILGQGKLEDWGEKLFNQSPILDLYILNIQTGKYQRVANVPNHRRPQEEEGDGGGITLGQPVWHPSGTSIAYTGWDAGGLGNMSRRLGMIFCRNRPSKIYVSDVSKLLDSLILTVEEEKEGNDNDKDDNEDKDFICITPDYVLSRSPQYVDMGGNDVSLVFLSNPKGFISHDGCMGLYQYKKEDIGSGGDDQSAVLDCILRVVQVPDNNNKQEKNSQPSLHGMGFPGLFLSQLPIDCGCGQQFVLVNTVWGSFQRIVRIDIKSGTVNLIHVEGLSEITSQSLLCKSSSSSDGNVDSWILSEVASNNPARIWNVHGLLSPADDNGIVHVKNPSLVFEFASITTTSFSSNKPNNFDIPIDLKVISIPPPDLVDNDDDKIILNGGDTNIQALVMIPRKTEKVPLIVIPHGGPHSGTISNYAPGFAFLASHYALVFPNYRGSVGFGQTMLECLMTRIGKVDVEDVMACTKYVLEEEKDRIDASRVGICGGSHGGFLTAHCTGQYPDFFKAAVMRNPVTNIASMVTATDIADWCYAEALGEYDSSKFRGPTLSEMTTMYEKSPIVHAGNVQTPTLVALGLVDLRVPPSQGKEWYHTLRSAGIDTQLLVYPEDCHALDKVTTEADHWINIKQWFDKYFR